MSFRNAARLLGDLGASENPLAWASGSWVESDGGSMWPVLSMPQHIQAAAATIACDAAAGVIEYARGRSYLHLSSRHARCLTEHSTPNLVVGLNP